MFTKIFVAAVSVVAVANAATHEEIKTVAHVAVESKLSQEQIGTLSTAMSPEQAGELSYDILVELMSGLGDEDFMQFLTDLNTAKLGAEGEQRRLVEATMAEIDSLHKSVVPVDERRRGGNCYGAGKPCVAWTCHS